MDAVHLENLKPIEMDYLICYPTKVEIVKSYNILFNRPCQSLSLLDNI